VACDRVISMVDPDASNAHYTVHRRKDGFKAHSAVEHDTGIISDCALTKASGADNHEAVVGLALVENEGAPVRVSVDLANGTGRHEQRWPRGSRRDDEPPPVHAPMPGGFTSDDCTIDFDARTVTCPTAQTSRSSIAAALLRKILPLRFFRHDAPRPCEDANSASTSTNSRCTPPVPSHAIPTGRPNTNSSGPWWNARSPGSPVTTEKSATQTHQKRSLAHHFGPDPHRHQLGRRLMTVAFTAVRSAAHEAPRP
jgi:hypothetical protein